MTFFIRGTVTVATIAASATSAFADCSLEVQQAFTRQSNTDMVRKELNLIGEQGPFNMTVEYVKPDRMRQVVKPIVEPEKMTETVLVGTEAWTKAAGGEWQKLDSTTTEQMVSFFKSTFANVPQNVGLFECMGAETVEGKKVRTYKGLEEPKKKTPEQLEAEKNGETVEEPKNEALRVIYLDVDTGLPARIVFAREGMLDKPIFKEVYTYPTDLKIEKPVSAKP